MFVLVATCLLSLLAVAQAQMDCGAGFFGDTNGCCPTLIDGLAYFPNSQGCYLLSLESGIFYTDKNGCYPNVCLPATLLLGYTYLFVWLMR